jgi:glycerol-3-phosphate dehydrogenase
VERFSFHSRPLFSPETSRKTYDIAIIGGGINGAGVARDAVLRGYRVILLEQADFASGTSSRSSRLIHGGLRYLEHGRLGLVHESVTERWRLMKLAPHLVRPLPFLFPIFAGMKPGLSMITAGTLAYSMLAAFRTPGPRRTHGAQSAAQAEPTLRQQGLKGAAEYYDCSTNDARLTLETALDAFDAGAYIVPRATVTGAVTEAGGVLLGVRDELTNETTDVRARVVVVAAGPWTDTIMSRIRPGTSAWLRPTKGVHIVFPRRRLPVNNAVVMPSLQGDSRITFAIPWRNHVYAGTTDTDYPNPDKPLTVSRNDVSYMLDITNHYFPNQQLTESDVVSTWAGLRPLVAPHDEVSVEDVNPSDISREEKLEVFDNRFVVAAGGKLTTYRVLAQKIVDKAAHLLEREGVVARSHRVTAQRPLPGGAGISDLTRFGEGLAAANSHADANWVKYLAKRYGARAHLLLELLRRDSSLAELLPNSTMVRKVELKFSIEQEYVCTIDDFMKRRTYIYFRTPDQGFEAAHAVADALVSAGRYTPEEGRAALAAYRQSITDSLPR